MNKKYIATAIVINIAIIGLAAFYLKDRFLSKETEPATISKTMKGEQGSHIHTVAPPPADSESSKEAPTVEIPIDKQQLIGVKTVEVAVRTLGKVIHAAGRVDYDEQCLSTVNAKFEGWIEKLFVNTTGQYVRKGSPLAEIYSPELLATQQEYLDLLKWKNGKTEEPVAAMLSKDADNFLAAVKRRFQLWDISDEQIKKLEETGQPMKTLTIFSKVDGYVVQKNAVLGMRVMPGEKLFDIADLSTVWIIADVSEQDLSVMQVGQGAKITLSAFPRKIFQASVAYIYPTLAGETRTAKLRFTINNSGGMLKPQMFTSVSLAINLGRRLAVPDDAVIDTGERQIVYVDRGEGNFEPREVTTGIRVDGFREITRGVRSGEKVAATATFLIDSEAQLKGVHPLSDKSKP
jgi:Cu(I)/Ag(I) efflux system membrane fusion protein